MNTLFSVLSFGALLLLAIGCGKQCGDGYIAVRQLRSTSNLPGVQGNVYEETVCIKDYKAEANAQIGQSTKNLDEIRALDEKLRREREEQLKKDREELERRQSDLIRQRLENNKGFENAKPKMPGLGEEPKQPDTKRGNP